jgi:ABC-type uncharacterized transport system permease subunit
MPRQAVVRMANNAAMRVHMASALSGLAVLIAAAPSAAQAATIYRWVDDQGKTHYSEQVPPKYQKTARALVSGAPNPKE